MKSRNRSGGSSPRVLRGFGISVRNNHLAYGYSVAMTASFGILAHTDGRTSVLHVAMFAVGPSVAFAATNAVVTRGYRERAPQQGPLVLALGSSLSVLSVGGATAVAGLAGWLLGGWAGWLVGSLLATVVYLVLSAAEAELAELVQRSRGLDHDAPRSDEP
jgi:hypothetical protein